MVQQRKTKFKVFRHRADWIPKQYFDVGSIQGNTGNPSVRNITKTVLSLIGELDYMTSKEILNFTFLRNIQQIKTKTPKKAGVFALDKL